MTLLLSVCLLLSFVLSVHGQCDGPSITIYSRDDADSISSCKTYNGDIIIDPSTTGNITLTGIENITGDLTANNGSISALSAPDLTTIGGTFELSHLLLLSTLDVPGLTALNSISWMNLPLLRSVDFEEGLSKAENIYIFDTGLLNIDGLGMMLASSIDISNNTQLETVHLQDLENVTSVSLRANAPTLGLNFESLQFVFGSMTFANISALSTPDLQNVTGAFTCYSCSMATYRSTWLQSVGLNMAFVSTDLSRLEFPDLTQIGGVLQLSNNSNLRVVDGFEMLESIEGGMTLNGNFDAISFESLGLVEGAALVETSSSNATLCDYFEFLKHEETIRGRLTCETSASITQTTNPSAVVDPGSGNDRSDAGATTSTSVAAGGDEQSGLSSGAVAGVVISAVVGIAAMALGSCFLLRRKRRRSTEFYGKGQSLPHHEMPPHGSQRRAELYGSSKIATEMSAQNSYMPEYVRAVPGVYEVEDGTMIAKEWSGTSTNEQSPISSKQRSIE